MTSVAEKLSPDPYIGTVLDQEFKIEEKLGSGGMGNVYRAVQRLTERTVAVKVLHGHVCDVATTTRFRQEAQIISRLSHPNIITIYKYGQHTDGTLYIAMEYLQGRPLDSVLRTGQPMDLERALPLMVLMADALAYAHDQKVIHRDIKPENMMLIRTGRSESIKILDFGIAKLVDGNATLTKLGLLCGSPPYMAPEQWQELRDIDGRTDLYALGCVFYELITGKQPFQASSVVGYMRAHLQGPPPAPPIDAGALISALPVLSDVVMRCLSRDRSARFPDAYSLVEILKEAQLHFDASRLERGPLSVRGEAPSSRSLVLTLPAGEAPSTLALLAESGPRPSPTAALDPTPSSPLAATTDPTPPPSPAAALEDENEDDDEAMERLREISQMFLEKDLSAASEDKPVVEPQAARTHLLLVATGTVLCVVLALALVLLR